MGIKSFIQNIKDSFNVDVDKKKGKKKALKELLKKLLLKEEKLVNKINKKKNKKKIKELEEDLVILKLQIVKCKKILKKLD